jgi:hypothetical protein
MAGPIAYVLLWLYCYYKGETIRDLASPYGVEEFFDYLLPVPVLGTSFLVWAILCLPIYWLVSFKERADKVLRERSEAVKAKVRADAAAAANPSLVGRVSEMPDTSGALSSYDGLNDQLREYKRHLRTGS